MLKFIVNDGFIEMASKILTGQETNQNEKVSNDLNSLLLLVELQEAKLYVVPKVYEEIVDHSKNDNGQAKDFMEKYCVPCELNYDDQILAENLAYNYGNAKVGRLPPIQDAKTEKSKFYNKAIIVAQESVATEILGGKVITLTDYYHYKIDIPSINVINERFGLPPLTVYNRTAIDEAIQDSGKEL